MLRRKKKLLLHLWLLLLMLLLYTVVVLKVHRSSSWWGMLIRNHLLHRCKMLLLLHMLLNDIGLHTWASSGRDSASRSAAATHSILQLRRQCS